MQVEIKSLNSNGDGVGFNNKNKKVFITKTAINDLVEYSIIKENKDFILGKLEKIVKKSTDRDENICCNVFDKCGGCNLLHLKEEKYYSYKQDILNTILKKTEYELDKIDFIKIPFFSRRRVNFQVRNNLLGFFEKNSNNLIEINSCPLIKNEINDIIPKLKELIKKIPITEISITSYENGVELVFDCKRDIKLNENNILKNLIINNENIIIISYKINGEQPFLFYQKNNPTISFDNNLKIKLQPNIFLQATLEGQKAITNIIIDNLKNYKNVLDLYCGIGTYTFPLSNFTKVHSVEGSQDMINILKDNIKENNLFKKITCEVKNLISSPFLKKELKDFDAIVINPPRNGAQPQCIQIAQSNIEKIVMVSCSPQSFIVDAIELKKGGYKLKSLTGIDQFYKTQHLEVVGVFEK